MPATAAFSVFRSTPSPARGDDESLAHHDVELVGAAALRRFLVHHAPIDLVGPLDAVVVFLLVLNARPAGQAHQPAHAAGVGDLESDALLSAVAVDRFGLRNHQPRNS